MNKNQLREKYLAIRDALGGAAREAKSLRVCDKIKVMPVFREARHVLFYYPVGSEVNLLPLMKEALAEGEKTIYLPKLGGGDQFRALPVSDTGDLKAGAFAIPEPSERGGEFDSLIDLVLVPGVAFDSNGGRIGMGKGYYDRYLKKLVGVPRIGVAFGEQMAAQFPLEAHDQRVEGVVTD